MKNKWEYSLTVINQRVNELTSWEYLLVFDLWRRNRIVLLPIIDNKRFEISILQFDCMDCIESFVKKFRWIWIIVQCHWEGREISVIIIFHDVLWDRPVMEWSWHRTCSVSRYRLQRTALLRWRPQRTTTSGSSTQTTRSLWPTASRLWWKAKNRRQK